MASVDDATCMTALARALGRPLPADAERSLAAYVSEVRRWNARVNLVSASAPEALVELLLADALVLADTELVAPGAQVLDVGAGAGAPTLPLLVLRPDLRALCVEPRHKRAAFLRATGARLGLPERLAVREERIDPDRPALAGTPYDFALARATFAPSEWLRIGVCLARRVAVLTAREPAPDAPAGFACIAARDYQLPTSGAPRRVSVYAPLWDTTPSRGAIDRERRRAQG